MDDFELIYRENALKVYRFLLTLGCPPQEAEDVIQDTFVKALLNIGSFRAESDIYVWLCSIAKNTWYTRLKRRKRRAPEPVPGQEAGHEGLYAWLDLIDRLPEPYREVFSRRALAGRDYADIAAAEGKSESWARVTYHRARLKLLDMLKEDGDR